ncbi:PepSY domain-containing protein [Mammaliicoccus sciuri]|uniref:PepSY domain-containing protein n=1 Tax=Mammaliicoccus sciuri TaxID=1296 RepID=UPI00066BBCA0|nr:PepSY domain-containing protein [Mammaliicoccus sciuri]MCD3218702.1 PepSY domain-containing protein [Mammaliicoccus sciuri]MCJ0921867.1 PepSY domain-containing protein [Mammaliicoccus sciuri]MCJ1760671.1 PepSY domain-containing protein [Mammaliicoccus sciuri]MDO0950466.1 PepSY domain-containing protein [Mammaliicoccus sciuri]MEB6286976.1 PepSY domain-containing protein [Mammaliicoccus sciuri]
MKYKMLSLLLSAGIVLAACGNGDDDNNDKKDNQNDEKTEQTTKENSNDDQNTDDDQDSDDDQNTDDDQSSDKTTENTVKWDDVKVSPEDAVKAAQKESKGELKDLSFEKETGDWSYKVELVDGTNENKVLINADDKSVTNVEKEQEDSDDNDQTFKLSDVAKFEDALKVAQDKAKGDIKEWSLSEDNGKLVYSIELKEGNKESTEFTIDAKSKEILEQETD